MASSPVTRPVPGGHAIDLDVAQTLGLLRAGGEGELVRPGGDGGPGGDDRAQVFRWSKPPAIQVRAINSPKARTSDPAIPQARRLDPTAAGLVSGLVVLASVTG